MSKLRLAGLALLLALAALPGCVELTGQRISWFYDVAKDELQILIHYDGIHDSGSDEHGNGIVQVQKFVAGGDVLIADWPFHLGMAEVREKVDDESADEQERAWARLLAPIEAKPIGYYREPNGRIGAAQLVTIPKASEFVRELNGLISAEILKNKANSLSPTVQTEKRLRAAAKADHQWIRLDGQAIRVSLPVHTGEWAQLKREFLGLLAHEVAQGLQENADEEEKKGIGYVIRALASVPLSYIDRGDQVEFVVGRADQSSTLRMQIRDQYEPSLEEVVTDTIEVDLDQKLTDILLVPGAESTAPYSAVLSWGPPETQVGALLAAAGSEDATRKEAAVGRLQQWARQWSRKQGVPETPPMDSAEVDLAAWKRWYERMK